MSAGSVPPAAVATARPAPQEPATVLVHGASLAGMAAAARLAKAGHHVVLDADALPDGGHWAARTHLGVQVDELPQTFLLPAAWRDLFKKSGRALDAELTRHGLALVPAPDQVHRFADGRSLVLPSERGAQHRAVAEAFGARASERWTVLLDELDELWQQLRPRGLEAPFDPATMGRAERAALLSSTTLDALAERAGDPHLATIVRSQAQLAGAVQGAAPALLAVRLAVQRRFGCWQLVDEAGLGQRASRMIDLLGERLDLRGVERTGSTGALLGSGMPDLSSIVADDQLDARVRLECLPQQPTGWRARRMVRPAMAPTVVQRIDENPPDTSPTGAGEATSGILEVHDHTSGAPVVTWRRPLGDGRSVETVHDHSRPRPDLAWGLAPATFKAWQHRTPLHPEQGPDAIPQLWQASAASHAGNEPWAELLSAALAVYEAHEHLTGEDIRPTNRTPPPPRRQARPGRRSAAS